MSLLNEKKNAAHKLISQGKHVVLWYPNKSAPKWKDHLNRSATSKDVDESVVDFDISIVPTNYVVVDLDIKQFTNAGNATSQNGFESFRKLRGDNPCHTLTTKTPSGGAHLWFKYDGDLTSCNCGDGIEFKHLTGTVHVPPSTGYTWWVKTDPIPAPNWLVDFWKKSRSSTVHLATQASYDRGMRHDSLKVFAAVARQHLHLNYYEMLTLLQETNDQRCSPPLPQLEVENIAAWASDLEATGFEVDVLCREPMKLYLARLIYG